MRLGVDLSILNQKGTPAFYSDIFANRPTYGFAGRVFISTDTGAIYEDTGTSWTLIADAGAGTTGTLQQVTTNGNTTTQGITISAGGLTTNSLNDTALTTGSVLFSGASGLVTQDNTNLFWDNTNKYLGIGNTGGPTAPLDIHNATIGQFIQLNATSTNNSNIAFLNGGTGKWRIGNVYNAGANNFNIYNIGLAANALSFNATNSNATFAANVSAVSFDGTATDGNYFLRNEDIEFRNHATSDSFRLVSRTTSTIAYIYFGPTGTAYFGYSGSQFVINDKTYINGNLLVGSSTAVGSNKLEITGTSYFSTNLGVGNSAPTAGLDIQYGSSSANISFRVRKADTFTTFYVRGDGYVFAPSVYYFTTGSAANMFIDTDGSFLRSTSSLKYKTNVRNYDKGLNELMQIRSVYYKGISEKDGNKQFAGFIAEEIDQLGLNEFVQYADDGTPDALNYQNMVCLLVKAIQELNDKLNRNNIN